MQVGSNRDLTLEQSLRVSISGTIADSVRVTAELSDQNLPIQPEGTTEELRELDKIMVEIASPRYRAVLGSYDVALRSGEFGAYDRRLEGILGEATHRSWGLSAGVATNRGRYNSVVLIVIDGNQGPYDLTDALGNSGVLVVAGTERVWLNGALLRRGETNDYVMDYAAGEITFTRHRLITSDMRIVVDYEYSSEDYERSTIMATARLGQPQGPFTTSFTFVQESDNAENPAFGALSDAAREALREAGDSPVAASLPGWALVDSGGTYRAVDLEAERFEWVGSGGDYALSFTRVGPGEGTYTRDESYFSRVFEYVGEGNGDWVPRLVYPLPERRRLLTSLTRLKPWRSLSVEMEAAASDADENTLSDLDDGDNTTYAGRAAVSITDEPVPVGPLRQGKLSASVTARYVEDGFEPLSRTTGAEDNRKWGLVIGQTRGGERTLEASATYDPAPGHRLAVEAGRLLRDSTSDQAGYDASRASGTWATSGAGRFTLRAHAEAVRATESPGAAEESSVAVDRGDASAEYRFPWVTPSVSIAGEQETAERSGERAGGDRFVSWSVGAARSGGALAVSGGVSRRVDARWYAVDAVWRDSLRSLTHTWRASLRDWHSLSLNGEYTWRRLRRPMSEQETISDVADVNVQWEWRDGLVRQHATYRVAGSRTARRERTYVYVGAGRGDYAPLDPAETRAILGEEDVTEVPSGDPTASYLLQYRATGTYRPTVDLDASWRFSLEPGRVWSSPPDPRSNRLRPLWQRALAVVSTETAITVSETDSTRNSDLYLVKFWKFREFGRSPTVRGSREIRQDVDLWKRSREGNVRFRLQDRETFDATVLGQGETPSIGRERSLSVRTRLRVTDGVEWTSELLRERESQTGSSLAYRANRWTSEQLLSYRPTLRSEWSLAGTFTAADDPEPEAALAKDASEALRAWLVGLEPRLRYSWGTRGMGRLSFQWSGVFARNNADGVALPIRLLNGRNPGNNFRWAAQMSYRLSALVTATVTYDGRRNAGSSTIHTGRAEVRAVF